MTNNLIAKSKPYINFHLSQIFSMTIITRGDDFCILPYVAKHIVLMKQCKTLRGRPYLPPHPILAQRPVIDRKEIKSTVLLFQLQGVTIRTHYLQTTGQML